MVGVTRKTGNKGTLLDKLSSYVHHMKNELYKFCKLRTNIEEYIKNIGNRVLYVGKCALQRMLPLCQ